MNKQFETDIGLEVHAELLTKSKIFCGCSTAFGMPPNTQVCPVCLGLPGSLPVLNRRAVELAILAGLATGCTIAKELKLDRKNYYYPDLPKGYQISQFDKPLCFDGGIEIETEHGKKRVRIERIHIEEDAGKLIHDRGDETLCDYNRCGVPLIEVVTKPDLRSADEAVSFVRALREILLFAGVSSCKMQEGALRCDVNLSVREMGEEALGERTEIKNLNSFQFIKKAILDEEARQRALVSQGERVVRETRRFDSILGKTFRMREKEEAADYRFFPEPDAFTVDVPCETVSLLQASLPALPDERRAQYVTEFGLSKKDANDLVSSKHISDVFDEAAKSAENKKTLASLFTTELFRLLPGEDALIPITPKHLAEVSNLLSGGELNSSSAKKLLSFLWEKDEDPKAVCLREDLLQISDERVIFELAQNVIDSAQKAVEDYRAGKKQAFQALLGMGMKISRGKANPILLTKKLTFLLENQQKDENR